MKEILLEILELMDKFLQPARCVGFFEGFSRTLILIRLGLEPNTILTIVAICCYRANDYNDFIKKLDKVIKALQNNV